MDETVGEKRPARDHQTKTGKAILRFARNGLLLRAGVNRQLKAGLLKNAGHSRKNPAKPSSNLKFSHRFVTTADAKIPLSVVRVKRQPQYVVFCAPYAAPSSATAGFACAKRRKPRPGALSASKSPRIATEESRAAVPKSGAPASLEPIPIPPRQQDARPVQFVWTPVRVVENAGQIRKGSPCWKAAGQFENTA